jgi:hypothetical protein
MYIRSITRNYLSEQCPNCLSKDAYRISITPNVSAGCALFALCGDCKFYKKLTMPSLDKKVIYLDQFVVDNIGKIGIKNGASRCKDIKEKLSSLVRDQLVICPTSIFHDYETSYNTKLAEISLVQAATEALACGTKFKDPGTLIEIILLHNLFAESGEILTVDKLLSGERNNWHSPRFRISLPIKRRDGEYREEYAEKITRYLQDKRRSPDEILNKLIQYYVEMVSSDVKKVFECKQASLESALREIPMLHIIAELSALISVEFAGTRKKPLNTGMATDIFMVSSILPYVDAIFVDQEIHTLLSKSKYIPARWKDRIYSFKGMNEKNDIKAFLNFLNSIYDTAPQYSYPPFKFTHAQLIKAYYEKADALSPLSQLVANSTVPWQP